MSRGTVSKYSVGTKTKWMFRVDIVGGREGRKQVTRKGFEKRGEAVLALELYLAEARPTADAHTDLGAWLERWIDDREAVGQIRPTTASSYKAKVRYIRDNLPGVELADLTAQQLTSTYVAMANAGLSARTIRYLHTVIKKAMTDAVAQGLIPSNPAATAMPPSTTAAIADERRIWAGEQGWAFLDRDRPMVRQVAWALVMTGGLRRSEMAGLRWGAISGDEITIDTTRASASGGAVVEGKPKTRRGRRTLVLPSSTIDLIREWRLRQA
ncbi:MAG: phage integrase SAM-like domain-containing protein, partial [Actinomycetota bacterium]